MEVCAVENRKDYGSPSDILKSGGDFAYWASLAMNSAGDGLSTRISNAVEWWRKNGVNVARLFYVFVR